MACVAAFSVLRKISIITTTSSIDCGRNLNSDSLLNCQLGKNMNFSHNTAKIQTYDRCTDRIALAGSFRSGRELIFACSAHVRNRYRLRHCSIADSFWNRRIVLFPFRWRRVANKALATFEFRSLEPEYIDISRNNFVWNNFIDVLDWRVPNWARGIRAGP